MTWSYDDAEASDKDKVRGLIGDVDTTDQLFSDAKITATLTAAGSVIGAAIQCAEGLAAKYARQVTHAVGAASINASDIAKQFESLAVRLRKNLALSASALPYAGGLSVVDKEAKEAESDRLPPYFTRTSFDNPGVPPQSLTTTDDVLP
jgi:hypothetical protein